MSGFNISTAVQGQNSGLDNCKLRNVQIDGNRAGAAIYQGGGGLIEMGGATSGQLVEYVHPYDPRSVVSLRWRFSADAVGGGPACTCEFVHNECYGT